jgi:hypothetical protein
MTRFRHFLAVPLLLVLAGLVLLHPAAGHAASIKPAYVPPTACKAHPSPANCNGQDPDATGCSADAVALASAAITGSFAGITDFGKVVVKYSPSCHSSWARMVSSFGYPGNVALYRSDGYEAINSSNGGGGSYALKTLMLYSNGYIVQAGAAIYIDSQNAAYGTTQAVYG